MSEEIEGKATAAQSVKTKKSLRLSWINIGILCTSFSIVVLILVGSYSYWCLLINNMQLSRMVEQSNTELQQLQESFDGVKKNSDAAQQTVQQYADEIKNLKQAIHELSQVKQSNQEKWLFAEAHYYVKQANDVLQFSGNISLAVTLLKLADREISSISNAKLAEVRKMLAADIAALQSVTQVDEAGIYAKLMAINNQLDKLPLVEVQTNQPQQKPATGIEQKQGGWQRMLYVVEQALQKIVVVRYDPNGTESSVLPQQKALIYQNLHMLLSQAVWALLQKQTSVYQSSLQQAATWIKRYYAVETPVTQGVLNELTLLEKIDVHPPVPTVTNTVQAFKEIEGP